VGGLIGQINGLLQQLANVGATFSGDLSISVGGATTQMGALLQQFKDLGEEDFTKPLNTLSAVLCGHSPPNCRAGRLRRAHHTSSALDSAATPSGQLDTEDAIETVIIWGLTIGLHASLATCDNWLAR
jgi:hypothetical protein